MGNGAVKGQCKFNRVERRGGEFCQDGRQGVEGEGKCFELCWY